MLVIYKVVVADRVIYIGCTSRHRLRARLAELRHRTLGDFRGLNLDIIEIQETEKRRADRDEGYWIKRFKSEGHSLANKAIHGGKAGFKQTDEWKLRAAEISRMHRHSPESKRKIGDANRGKTRPDNIIRNKARARITDDMKRIIRDKLANGAYYKDVAKEFGVHHTYICMIKSGAR